MLSTFHDVSPGYRIMAWVNCVPYGAPESVIESGYDYTAYCSKPFALLGARLAGADIAILLDAAFYPIRPIQPLVDHIAQTGYYFCKNGNLVGEWTSDRCLERMGVTRQDAMGMEEISSYCVGLNIADGRCHELLWRWCGFAADRLTIPGYHTNLLYRTAQLDMGERLSIASGRNIGVCSMDPRTKGHRHDQSVLSILAHQMKMTNLTERPRFTAYKGSSTEETVLENWGGM